MNLIRRLEKCLAIACEWSAMVLLVYPAENTLFAQTEGPDLQTVIQESIHLQTKVNETYISFPFQLTNHGTVTATGNIKVQAYVIPAESYSFGNDVRNNGVYLETNSFELNLAVGARMDFVYDTVLPQMEPGRYLLGIVINTDQNLAETNHLNNASSLVPFRVIHKTSQSFVSPVGSFDLYGEIEDSLDIGYGGISHGLRTVLRGDPQNFPSEKLPDTALWARFLAVNAKTKQAYVLPYDSETLDKNWYNVAYEREHDANGQLIHVDYYGQSPRFGHVPPGVYRFIIMLNSRDLIPEYKFNNLEVRGFRLDPIRITSLPEVWLKIPANQEAPVETSVTFDKVYRKDLSWVASSNQTWLGLSTTEGTITGDSGESTLPLKVHGKSLAAGVHQAELTLRGDEFAAYPITVPVRIHAFGDLEPKIKIEEKTLDLQIPGTTQYAAASVKIKNPGTGVLTWSAHPNKDWVVLESSSGTVRPGGEATMQVMVHTRGIGPGWKHQALIQVLSDGTNEHPTIELNLEVVDRSK